VEKQIGEEAIEFDQNPGGDRHPQGCHYWGSAEKFDKVIHSAPEGKRNIKNRGGN
jgi:hypothetical protein